jgi:cytochrome oxidase assembly protein ShyY1
VSAPAADRQTLVPGDLRLVSRRSVAGALGLLREGPWLRSTLAVVAASVAFVLLGQWQLHRHEAKVARRDRVAADYDAAPVPLAALLGSPSVALPADAQWRPVRVAGRYDPGRTVLVRNRPFDGEYGYEVLVPLRTTDGGTLLVDRGWIPFGESATRLPPVPAPPSGPVEIVVRLRPGEPAAGGRQPAGQAIRIDLDGLAGQLDPDGPGRLYRAYGVLADEVPRPAVAPALLRRPDTGLGPHLAYAWNWWGFAAAAYGLLGYYALREVRDRALAARGVDAGQVAALRADRRADRPRRRLRDEDWEDAAAGG